MITNYLFSKYFFTAIFITFFIGFFADKLVFLQLPLFMSLIFVNGITLNLFFHKKKLSQFFDIFKENLNFTILFGLYMLFFTIIGLISDSSNQTFDSSLSFLFFSMLLLPLITIDITSLATMNKKLDFKDQLSLFKSKDKFKTLLISSIVFTGLSLFISHYFLLTFITIYTFFTYFVTSKHYQEVDTE